MARLGDIIEQIRGVSYKPTDLRDILDENSVPLLRANNIQDGNINLDDLVYVSKNKVAEKQYLKKGDILICASSGSKELVGKAAYIEQDMSMTFGAFCKVVRPKTECPKYIGHFFQSSYYRRSISDLSAGVNINNIRNEHIANLEILLPPLEEQRRITALLDKVSDLIAKRRAQLDKLDLLVKARFVEMFGDITANPKGWKKEKLQSHIDMITGFPFNSSGYSENGVKICGGLIIMPDQIKWDECKFWPDSLGYEQFLLQEDDIVVALDRPWISEGFKIGEIKAADLPALLIQRTARIRGRDITQQFLLYSLKDKAFEQHCTLTGSLVPHISNKDINSYEVILPPFELQQQFEEFSHKIKSLKLTAQKSLDKLEILKKALIQQYFG